MFLTSPYIDQAITQVTRNGTPGPLTCDIAISQQRPLNRVERAPLDSSTAGCNQLLNTTLTGTSFGRLDALSDHAPKPLFDFYKSVVGFCEQHPVAFTIRSGYVVHVFNDGHNPPETFIGIEQI